MTVAELIEQLQKLPDGTQEICIEFRGEEGMESIGLAGIELVHDYVYLYGEIA